MPLMETITVVNKSGKVVTTGKHLVNIFREAKEAYQDKKAEIKYEHRMRIEAKEAQKMLENMNIQDDQSVALSKTSRRSKSTHKTKSRTRPALTEANLSEVFDERPDLSRRRTAFSRPWNTAPRMGPSRTMTTPVGAEAIDMNLAYGDIPPGLMNSVEQPEAEMKVLMSRLDTLMCEAECVQHTATTIIGSLQKDPEAMAAVALTLAEISALLAKASPSLLTILKTGSPAILALLASPQFLIAGGVAVGVTIVMFGGYKIIKKIQASTKAEPEAIEMDEALVYQGDLNSIESWRRGIADSETMSVGTSVDGEFITPEAASIRRERIRSRAREERRGRSSANARSDVTGRSSRRKDGLGKSLSRKTKTDVEENPPDEKAHSKSSKRSSKEKKERKDKVKDDRPKEKSSLMILFKGPSKAERERLQQPRMIES